MGEGLDAVRMARLVREYGERAFRFAYRLTGNVDEAQELVQEAYRRALQHGAHYDSGQPLENWFFTILRHLFLDGARRRERDRMISLDAPVACDGVREAATYADMLPSEEEAVLNVLERRESVQIMREALEGLSYEHRAALTMCDVEGLGYEEIARVMELPVGTVRSRISRARAALKRGLLKRQGVKDDDVSG